MKKLILLTVTLLTRTAFATADVDYETSCRVKAKELAAQAYRSCVTENKTAQIDQMRKEYQDKLKALKAEYEKEIQRVSGKKVAKATAPVAAPKKAKQTEVVSTPAPSATDADETTMDLPEPIPVE